MELGITWEVLETEWGELETAWVVHVREVVELVIKLAGLEKAWEGLVTTLEELGLYV